MIAFIFLGLICASLAAEPGVNDESDPTHGGIFNKNYEQQKQPNKLPGEYIHIDEKNDQFDWELTKQILKTNPNKNTIVSPLSVKTLMTLIAEAAGQSVDSLTRRQLEAVLPYDKKLNNARIYFENILNSTVTRSKDYKVNFGTRIFVDKNANVEQKFGAIAEFHYLAKIEQLNFNDAQGSARHINEFAKQVTEGKIANLVNEEAVSNAVLLLVNALYFEGKWLNAFNKTVQRQFNGSNGRKQTTFMEHTRNYYFISSDKLNSRILRIPYAGEKYSMFIILPKDGTTVDQVISKLDHRALSNEIKDLEEIEVHAVIPRFKFDTSVKLNDAIKAMGITEIFENTATLPGLARGGATEGKLKVSNIIQKSGIVVDEKGTTAWSATEIEIVNKFGGDPREFIADRPFLFYIEDETNGAKLFTGRVDDP